MASLNSGASNTTATNVGLSGPLGMNGVNAYSKPPSSQFQGVIGGMQMNA